ncbi:MAG TPA: DUF2946 domain-containing protein [Janthinobacterium sp.]|nr:DUF2946 domain-containing protein [Janthinobacterium sp.]
MTTLQRQLTAWIACFAILLAALAPSISHAIAAGKNAGSGWIEICSAAGSKFVSADQTLNSASSTSSAPAEKSLHFDHCPFCSTHGGPSAPPPAVALSVPAVSGKAILPSLYYQAPRPLHVWASAQSRAPPALS